jgi:hypothetical protein
LLAGLRTVKAVDLTSTAIRAEDIRDLRAEYQLVAKHLSERVEAASEWSLEEMSRIVRRYGLQEMLTGKGCFSLPLGNLQMFKEIRFVRQIF